MAKAASWFTQCIHLHPTLSHMVISFKCHILEKCATCFVDSRGTNVLGVRFSRRKTGRIAHTNHTLSAVWCGYKICDLCGRIAQASNTQPSHIIRGLNVTLGDDLKLSIYYVGVYCENDYCIFLFELFSVKRLKKAFQKYKENIYQENGLLCTIYKIKIYMLERGQWGIIIDCRIRA